MNILEAREERSKHIESLMEEHKYKSIVILKLNVVGTDKNPPFMRFICLLFDNFIKKEFKHKIITSKKNSSDDGDYVYYVIDEEGSLVKERTMSIEDNNYLGRLVDIDVYYQKSISRSDMKCDMRKCIICDNYAHICVRNQTHSKKEIFDKVHQLINEHLPELIMQEVMRSIYEELEMYPKFGLVTNRDSGVHQDMDYELFIKSTFAIKPYIKEYIEYGLGDIDNPLLLKEIGLKAEQAMFDATNNINTQKGLIFALGIFLPAMTKTIITNNDCEFFRNRIKYLSNTIIGNYYETLDQNNLTHGDEIYLKHGIKGIRGETLNGFPLIFEIPHIDSFYDSYEYFIRIMAKLDDTTIIHRTDLETLNLVKKEMQNLINIGGYIENKDTYNLISEKYKQNNISPGGSSDILVLKLIFEKLRYLLCITCIE
jgi:holo-ACP synthase CitX